MRVFVAGHDAGALADEVRAVGAEVVAARTGEALAPAAAEAGADLVLVGWGGDAAQTLQVLAAAARPAIGRLVAAIWDSEEAADALRAGADDVVARPIGAAQLEQRRMVLARRREVLDALRRSEASFRSIIEHSPDAMVVVSQGAIVFVNQAVLALMRMGDARQALGQHILDFVHPEDRPQFVSRAGDGRRTGARQCRILLADGSSRLAEVQTLPVQFDGRRSLLVVFRDIAERLRMQEQLLVTDRLASVGTMAAGVAHEINNPLSWVISGIGWLEEELADLGARVPTERAEEVARTLGEVRDGAERVQQIVRDLKAFSRVDVADAAAARGVDLPEVLETALALAANELRHRARITKEFEPSPRVGGNAVRLGQVFLNLIVNAAHAIPEGHADENEIRIRISPAADGRVQVRVEDTGCGMPVEIQRRIFDPFFTTKPVGEGTGLGLSIAHAIVKGLGGEISVQSERDLGTAITILLPVADPSAAAEAEEARPAPPRVVRRGRVLVVDDEPMIGASLKRMLSAEHEVVTLSRARDAVALLESGDHRFDVVLSDLMMPEMSGIDFHAELGKRWPELAPKVVFLTGGAFTARAREFLEKTTNRWVEKPFDVDALRAVVRDLVSS